MNRGRHSNGDFFDGLGASLAMAEPSQSSSRRKPHPGDEPDYGSVSLAQEPNRRSETAATTPGSPADAYPSNQPPLPIYREKPVAAPPQALEDFQAKARARKQANVDQNTLGLSGTANLMGFLQDLGEPNAEFRGLQAMQIYEKMRREDPTVASVEAAIRLPIRGAEWNVEPGVDETEPGYALAKEIAEKVEENLMGGLESETESGAKITQTLESAIENLLLTPIFGCAAHEDLWAPDADKNQIRLRGLQPLLPRTFYQFLPEADGNTLKTLIQFGYRGALVQILPVPAEKICLTTFNREGSYFYGRSILRAAHMPWKFKRQMMVIDAIGAEKNRIAVPVIEQGPNASQSDKEASWEWVKNLAANERTGLSLPNGWTFKQAGIEGRAVSLTDSIRLYDEQILDAALAGFLSLGKTATGSRALGDVKMEFFLLSEQALANMIGDQFSNTTIRRWVDWNYDLKPEQQNLYPKLRCGTISVINVMDEVDALSKAGKADVGWLNPDEDGVKRLRRRMGYPPAGKPIARWAPTVVRVMEQTQGDLLVQPGEKETAAGTAKPAATDRAPIVKQPEPRTPDGAPPAAPERAGAKLSSLASRPVIAARATPSTFWQPGDPEHLRNVHPQEAHVDFPGHARALRNAESDLQRSFAALRMTRQRRFADLMARAIKSGKNPAQVTFPHDAELEANIQPILERLYGLGRSEVKQESARAAEARREAWRRSVNPQAIEGTSAIEVRGLLTEGKAADLKPGGLRYRPGLIAEVTVQDVDSDLANATRKAAIDLKRAAARADFETMNAGEIADRLFGEIGSVAYVDAGLAQASAGAARSAFRAGRDEEFQAIAEELKRQGVEIKLIRVSAREKASCDSCLNADGDEVEPGEDITAIHEGPPETCECEVMESV